MISMQWIGCMGLALFMLSLITWPGNEARAGLKP